MFELTSFAALIGTLYINVAKSIASPASWIIFHSEEVPNELKK